MGLVNIAAAVAVVALAMVADINTTHTQDIMILVHLATALADASTAEERANRPHIRTITASINH